MRRILSGIVLATVAVSLTLLSGCGGGGTYPTQSVTISPSGSLAINQGQSVALTAAVANDQPSFAGVNWVLSGSGSLSGTTTTAATYNAPTSGVSTATTATVTANSISSGLGTNATKSITVNPPLAVTTTTLAAGKVGTAYNVTLASSGGSGAKMWTVASGTLPTGISLSGAGVLSGTATAAGSATLTFLVTDSSNATAGASTATSVSMTLTFTPYVLSITTAALPNAVVNTAYTATLASQGGTGAITWSATGLTGTGLALNSSTGVISGTPTSTTPISANVTATDSGVSPNQQTASTTLSITVLTQLSVGTSTLPAATIGVAYTATVTASGGVPPYTWSTTGLPMGLSLNTSTGAITGTPTVPAGQARTVSNVYSSNSYSITVKDSGTPQQTSNVSLSMTVNAGTPAVTTATLPVASVNVAYSTTLTATAAGQPGSATWAITTGASALTTAGFSLNPSTGVISGTATSTAGSPISLGVTVSYGIYTSAVQNLTLTIANGPQISTSSLAPAYVNTAYSATLNASGGAGSNVWSVTSGQSLLTTLGLTLTGNGNSATLAGTPTTTGSGSVTFKVTDSNSASSTATLTVGAYNALSLPSPNPNTLPGASVTGSYSGTIVAAGGVGSSYTWTVNSTQLTNNTPQAITSGSITGLSVTTTGNNTLTVSGTPSTTGTVTLNVSVKDGANTTVSNTYTIAVTTTYSISGTVSLNSSCGGQGNTLSGVSVALSGTSTATTTTNGSGQFSFTGLAAGSYTITPSITGPTSSLFLPATQSVTISTSNATNYNFLADLGYTVSGAVSYGGSKTGRIYLYLQNNQCSGGNSSQGTSIAAAGSYSIRGVPPGTYTLQSYMDNLGQGNLNQTNPSGNSLSDITVGSSNVTGANVTISDPTLSDLSTLQAPSIQAVGGFNGGAVMLYQPVTSGNTEAATSYTLQYSTDQTFNTGVGSKTFAAGGTNGATVWIVTGLTNSSTYYFRVKGANGSTSTAYSTNASAVIGAPTGGNTVTGTVSYTLPAGQGSSGPLYVGFVDPNQGQFYFTPIANPTVISGAVAAAYTVQVPTGSSYYFVGVVDMNSNGAIDVGDISNTTNLKAYTAITGATSNENLSLSNASSVALVNTQDMKSTANSNTFDTYSLTFKEYGNVKLPVAVAITSGSNVLSTQDVGVCTDCGKEFNYYVNLGNVAPTAGAQYGLQVTYSDGTSETLTPAVSTPVFETFVTGLSPQTGGSVSTTPTFTWTYPTNPTSYSYQFYMNDNTGFTDWQVPGNNSNSGSFASTDIPMPAGLVYNVDPTNGSNHASPTVLSTSTTYTWSVTVQNANGDSTVRSVQYQP